jgi:hypothetical protein
VAVDFFRLWGLFEAEIGREKQRHAELRRDGHCVGCHEPLEGGRLCWNPACLSSVHAEALVWPKPSGETIVTTGQPAS